MLTGASRGCSSRRHCLLGHHLAGRIAGDTTVAFSWAYCMAAERALNVFVPPRAQWLRALLLERERVANHLGDLGALGNDAGFAFGLAQFSRLKEDWLRLNDWAFGHRYLMDRIVPGASYTTLRPTSSRPSPSRAIALRPRSARCSASTKSSLACRIDLRGQAGCRRSWPTISAFADWPRERVAWVSTYAPITLTRHTTKCRCKWPRIAAGTWLRALRCVFKRSESLRLIRAFLADLPDGDVVVPAELDRPPACGVGWIEGWRGDVFVTLETGDHGTILRCHCHHCSWQNWPALEHAIIGNIVPDFPLINKSFNLNYAGHDL